MPLLQINQFGQKRTLPLYSGKTVEFFRYLTLARTATALTEGISYATTNTSLTGQTLQVTIAKYGDHARISQFLSLVHIDPKISEAVDLFGDQAGRSLEHITNLEVFENGIFPVRTDDTAAYRIYKKAPSGAGTTTTLVDATNLTQATTDYWKGGWVVYTGQTVNYGMCRRITAFNKTTDTITWTTAVGVATGTSDEYSVVVPTSLTSGLTSTGVRLAVRKLKENKALPYQGGMFAGILNPGAEYNLMSSSNWLQAKQYSDVTDLYKGEIGSWFGVRFVVTTEPYTIASTSAFAYSATGTLVINPIMGKEAYGVLELTGQGKHIIAKNPGPNSTENPLDQYSTVGWAGYHACKALNAAWNIGLLSAI